MKIIGAIIAGGKSSRMGGQEKAFLKLAGKSILDLVIGRFDQQVDQVIINANGDGRRFSDAGLEVVPDSLAKPTTPLAGLHAGLSFAKDADFLVTVPSDAPFLPLDLVLRLVEGAQDRGAAIAHSGGQDHYIIGAWKTGLLPELERAIHEKEMFRMKDWVSHVSAGIVTWPHLPYDPFFNLNTRDDLKLAEGILRANP
jgi:molybdenum cofactor guanylyltransferase